MSIDTWLGKEDVHVCIYILGFPGGSGSKESTNNAEDLGLILGLGRPPGEGNSQRWGKSLNVIYLNDNIRGEKNITNSVKAKKKKSQDKIQHSLIVKPKAWVLPIEGIFLNFRKWSESCSAQLCPTLLQQSMEFYRPEYWSVWAFPSPGDLPNPGIKPMSPALWADSLPAEPPGKPFNLIEYLLKPYSQKSILMVKHEMYSL